MYEFCCPGNGCEHFRVNINFMTDQVCGPWVFCKQCFEACGVAFPWTKLYSESSPGRVMFFMPPPLGAGGIMFSGCPSVRLSVRSLKYPLLTCTWVRWSTRPTVTVLRHVRPSVRPSGEVSGHLPENAWRDWPEILYADVSWPSLELISLWLWSVDFSNFGGILT